MPLRGRTFTAARSLAAGKPVPHSSSIRRTARAPGPLPSSTTCDCPPRHRCGWISPTRSATARRAKAGASDGVTFRVWVDDERVFERHTATKTWLPGEVDLGAWARRTIRLRLEPPRAEAQHGLRCELLGRSGGHRRPAAAGGDAGRARDGAGAGARLAAGRGWRGGRGGRVCRRPCRRPAGCGGAGAERVGGWRNRLRVGGGRRGSAACTSRWRRVLGAGPAGAAVERVEAGRDAAGRTQFRHHLALDGRRAVLTATVWAEGPALRVKVGVPRVHHRTGAQRRRPGGAAGVLWTWVLHHGPRALHAGGGGTTSPAATWAARIPPGRLTAGGDRHAARSPPGRSRPAAVSAPHAPGCHADLRARAGGRLRLRDSLPAALGKTRRAGGGAQGGPLRLQSLGRTLRRQHPRNSPARSTTG